jgi:anaerobic selenocysteine-containing dehydrogenase
MAVVFIHEALRGEPPREVATIAGEGAASKVPCRRGVVALPHGYGQAYAEVEGRVAVGPRRNFLTMSEDYDPIVATPRHKMSRCVACY